LILIGIGLVLNPLRILISVGKDLLPTLSRNTWLLLTTPGTQVYHPLWAPLLIFELVGNVVFVVFSIIAAVYFFRKRRLFPKMMIALLIANLAFVVVDYLLSNSIPFIRAQSDPESARDLSRAIIACLIWVPYFVVSKRVKATFVH
jgi:hypothetical protein